MNSKLKSTSNEPQVFLFTFIKSTSLENSLKHIEYFFVSKSEEPFYEINYF